MGYRVIRAFADATDRMPEFENGYCYQVGDEFPRPGFKADDKWIRKLLTGDNTTGGVYLEYVSEEAEESEEEVIVAEESDQSEEEVTVVEDSPVEEKPKRRSRSKKEN